MSKSANVSRPIALLVALMAAIVLLSGPVAQVLDLPEPVAEAKKKHKKKHRPRPPAFNTVQCVDGQICSGTAGSDFLVGTDSLNFIGGGEGNDVYQANGGDDELDDASLTSSDAYIGYQPSFAGFGADIVNDQGGASDFLDLGSLRVGDDVAFIRRDVPGTNTDDLFLDVLISPGFDNIEIDEHFGKGRIETIRFANGTITGTQAQSLAREATPEEQAAFEERLDEERPSSSGEATNQEEQASS